MLDTLDEERRKIQLLRRRAGEYEDSVAIALTTGERWRIPIIFIKVKNGKPLKKSDNRIWSILTRDIAPGEVTAKVAAALQYSMPMRDAAAGGQPMPSPGKSGTNGGKPRTQSTGSNGRRGSVQFNGGKTSAPSSLRRAGTQSGSMTGSTLSAGLSAMGASMKRRLGLTVSTDGDVTDEGGDESFAENANARASKKMPSPARTPKVKAPAEFVNPRGTNISITPKPRSFLPPPKKTPKPKDSGLSASGSQSLSSDTRGMSVDVSSDTATAGAVLNANEASNKFDENASNKGSGLSARIAASFSSFSASMKRTFSYRTRASSTVATGDVEDEQLTGENDDFNSKPSLKTTLGIDTGADNSAQRTHSDVNEGQATPGPTSPGPSSSPMSPKAGANNKAGSFQHKVSTTREHSGLSSPKNMIAASPKASPTASQPASSPSFFGGASSAEEYRENMLKKQAQQTAHTYQALTTSVVVPVPGVSEGKYAVSEGGVADAQQASVSPIEQFFSSISPWGKSAKVVPGVPKGVSGSNLMALEAQ